MLLQWKIFRFSNILVIVLILLLFGHALYIEKIPHYKSWLTYVSLAVTLLIPTVMVSNCVNNIYLLKAYLSTDNNIFGKKVFFWILFAFFTILILLFLYLLVIFNNHSWYGYMFYTVDLLIVCCGIYIIIQQIRLFNLFKQKYETSVAAIINELGNRED